MGTPDFSLAALAQLYAAYDIIAVYTQPSKPAGRGQSERPRPVQVFAEKYNLPVCSPKSLKSAAVQAEFSAWNADVAVVAAYGMLLPSAILDAPRLGCINIHASLLPRWRGPAPIQRAIMEGDSITGITTMQMDAGLDTGEMLLTQSVPINAGTIAGELHDRLADISAALILETLEGLASGALLATPQPLDGVTYAAKVEKIEAHINFDRSSVDVLRHIHGLSPFPGAWFAHQGRRIKVLRAELISTDGSVGMVLDDHLTIACAEGSIRALKVQRPGKAPIDASAFLRGYALPKGTQVA